MALVATLDIVGETDERRNGGLRAEIGQSSTLRADGVPHSIVVEDLSSSGFRFSARAHLAPQTIVRLGLSGAGIAEARVVRRQGDVHGCAFLRPLTRNQLQSAFTAGDVVAGAFVRYDHQAAVESEERWPAAARLAILFGGGALAWLGVIGLIGLL
jgi:hypothetical protein